MGAQVAADDGYAFYEIGKYDDTIQAARRYVTLHPGSPDAAYAQYLMASSFYDQIPDITRDQRTDRVAIDALDEVMRKYPNTEYADSAKQKLEVARDQLAGKEMLLGRYYLEAARLHGAINRFKAVITQYQTTRQVEEALMRLAEAYMALGIVHEAQTAAAVLGHNFPDSPWYKDASSSCAAAAGAARAQGLLDQQGVRHVERQLRYAADHRQLAILC